MLPGKGGVPITKLADDFISADVATTRASKTDSRPADGARPTKDGRPANDGRPSKGARPSKSSPSRPKDRPSAYPPFLPPLDIAPLPIQAASSSRGIHIPMIGWIGLLLVIVLVGLGGAALLTSSLAQTIETPPPSGPGLVVLPSASGGLVVIASPVPSGSATPSVTLAPGGASPSTGKTPAPTAGAAPTAVPTKKPTATPTPTLKPTLEPTQTPVVIAFKVVPGQVSSNCKTGAVIFQLKLDNTNSNVSVPWSIAFSTSPDINGDWGSASPASGTIAAGATAVVDITPNKLCPLQSQTDYQLKVGYGSNGTALVTYTLSP